MLHHVYISGPNIMPKELFDVVNENDEVVGKTSREECHERKLIHRSVMFFVLNNEGKILVTKRTEAKDFFPGYWSIVLGGHVKAGEGYEEAVEREIKEEVGIQASATFIKSFKKRIPEEKENVKVYGVVARDDPTLNKEELEKGDFLSINELKERLKVEKFLPETEILVVILNEFLSSQELQNI